jgi:hypothetical protein
MNVVAVRAEVLAVKGGNDNFATVDGGQDFLIAPNHEREGRLTVWFVGISWKILGGAAGAKDRLKGAKWEGNGQKVLLPLLL